MRRIVAWYSLALVLLPTLALSELPPLIDRDLFFTEPEVSGMQISPDGAYLSFVQSVNGVPNLWVKKTGEPFAKARPLTEGAQRAPWSHFWSRDSKYILFEQ